MTTTRPLKTMFSLFFGICLIATGIVGCSSDEETPQKESTEEQKPNEEVLAVYTDVLDNIEDYATCSAIENEDGYSYSLAYLNNDDIPELLVGTTGQNETQGFRILSYHPNNNKLFEASDCYAIGIASQGGFRGSVNQAKDKRALIWDTSYSGTGNGTAVRLELKDTKVVEANKWEYQALEYPEELEEERGDSIEFYSTDDRDFLEKAVLLGLENVDSSQKQRKDSSKKIELKTKKARDISEDKSDESPQTKNVIPDDPHTITGKVRILDCYGVANLQPEKPEAKALCDSMPNETYAILVYSSPRTMTFNNGGEPGVYTAPSKMARLVDTSDVSEWQKYDGQTVTVTFSKGFWPSDASLPLGEGRLYDAKVVK